jgi:hypothetical protein
MPYRFPAGMINAAAAAMDPVHRMMGNLPFARKNTALCFGQRGEVLGTRVPGWCQVQEKVTKK